MPQAFKGLRKPFKAPQRSMKLKICVNFLASSRKGCNGRGGKDLCTAGRIHNGFYNFSLLFTSLFHNSVIFPCFSAFHYSASNVTK